MLAWKIAPAIAAGNTVVLKPAEFTLTVPYLLNYAKKRDYPKVLLLLSEMAQVRHSHQDTKKLLSLVLLKLGKIIQSSAEQEKLTMELGGKSPLLFLKMLILIVRRSS